MTKFTDPIGQIRRDHPQTSQLRSDVLELEELWELYAQWKGQWRELNEAKGHLTNRSPKSADLIERVLGSIPEFEQAGEALRSSLTARLAEIEKHDLVAAVKHGELSEDERVQVQQINIQWRREAELEAISQSHERDDERRR